MPPIFSVRIEAPLQGFPENFQVIDLNSSGGCDTLVAVLAKTVFSRMDSVWITVLDRPSEWKGTVESLRKMTPFLSYDFTSRAKWRITPRPETITEISATLERHNYHNGAVAIVSKTEPLEKMVSRPDRSIRIDRADGCIRRLVVEPNGKVIVKGGCLPSVKVEGHGEIALFHAEHIDELVVLDKIPDGKGSYTYSLSEISPVRALLVFCEKADRHSSFDEILSTQRKYLPALIELAKTPNADSIFPLLQWTPKGAGMVMQFFIENKIASPPPDVQRRLLKSVLSEYTVRFFDTQFFTAFFRWCPESVKAYDADREELLTTLLCSGVPATLYSTLIEDAYRDADSDPQFRLFCAAALGYDFTDEEQVFFKMLDDGTRETIGEIAKVNGNPHVYLPADRTISPQDYTINLLWFNEYKVGSEEARLFGKGATEEEKKADFAIRFIHPITEWAKKNPGTRIHIWYYGTNVPCEVVEKVKQQLVEAWGGSCKDAPFIWRNLVTLINTTRVVGTGNRSNAHKVFRHTLPLYFRIDLAKEMIINSVYKKYEEPKYVVVTDLSIGAMERVHLFDKKTVGYLDKLGVVITQGGEHGYENGFLMYDRMHPMMDSHRIVMVENQISYAYFFPKEIFEQQIFSSYSQLLFHWLVKAGKYRGRYERAAACYYKIFASAVKNVYSFELDGGSYQARKEIPMKPVVHRPSHFSRMLSSEDLPRTGYSPAFCEQYYSESLVSLNKKWEPLLRLRQSGAEAGASAAASCTAADE